MIDSRDLYESKEEFSPSSATLFALTDTPKLLKTHPTKGQTVTLGDMHGNALRLVYELIQQGVFEVSDKAKKDGQTLESVYAELLAGYQAMLARRLRIDNELSPLKKQQNAIDEKIKIATTDEEKTALSKELNKLTNDISSLKRKLNEAKSDSSELAIIAAGEKQFLAALDQLAIAEDAPALRLIGDVLADRGASDKLTLAILQKLLRGGLPYSIHFANHDADLLITAYDGFLTGKKPTLKGNIKDIDSTSKTELLEHKEEFEKIRADLYEAWLSKMQLFSLEENADKIFGYFTHAPVGLEAVAHAANYLEVPFKAANIRELQDTLNQVNHAFIKFITNDAKRETFYKEINELEKKNTDIRKTHPLFYLCENRSNLAEASPAWSEHDAIVAAEKLWRLTGLPEKKLATVGASSSKTLLPIIPCYGHVGEIKKDVMPYKIKDYFSHIYLYLTSHKEKIKPEYHKLAETIALMSQTIMKSGFTPESKVALENSIKKSGLADYYAGKDFISDFHKIMTQLSNDRGEQLQSVLINTPEKIAAKEAFVTDSSELNQFLAYASIYVDYLEFQATTPYKKASALDTNFGKYTDAEADFAKKHTLSTFTSGISLREKQEKQEKQINKLKKLTQEHLTHLQKTCMGSEEKIEKDVSLETMGKLFGEPLKSEIWFTQTLQTLLNDETSDLDINKKMKTIANWVNENQHILLASPSWQANNFLKDIHQQLKDYPLDPLPEQTKVDLLVQKITQLHKTQQANKSSEEKNKLLTELFEYLTTNVHRLGEPYNELPGTEKAPYCISVKTLVAEWAANYLHENKKNPLEILAEHTSKLSGLFSASKKTTSRETVESLIGETTFNLINDTDFLTSALDKTLHLKESTALALHLDVPRQFAGWLTINFPVRLAVSKEDKMSRLTNCIEGLMADVKAYCGTADPIKLLNRPSVQKYIAHALGEKEKTISDQLSGILAGYTVTEEKITMPRK